MFKTGETKSEKEFLENFVWQEDRVKPVVKQNKTEGVSLHLFPSNKGFRDLVSYNGIEQTGSLRNHPFFFQCC